MTRLRVLLAVLALFTLASRPIGAAGDAGGVDRLVAAMLGETPLISDLRSLTDEVGGRPTGSPADAAGVAWALARFAQAGVPAKAEAFDMPARWFERSAAAELRGDVRFEARVAAMPFSVGTPAGGLSAPLLDGGFGSEDDVARLGDGARGAFVLVETHELQDVAGLFAEYAQAAAIEARLFAAGVRGVAYVGSRPRNVLYRHNASRGPANEHPLVVLERSAGLRALRLLREGRSLELWLRLDIEAGGPYQSHNVIGEIAGSARPEEFVVIGAHLDSWGIGTGALDNGCNVALVIDVARQMRRLGLRPRRTIRFALWNGEEQGLVGSWQYTRRHAAEMDRHVMASSYDIGSGRITGFFTGGRPELLPRVEEALRPVRGLGPFTQLDVPIVGTDNYDFMVQGIANLVANQESANYGPNYHAGTDTFEAVDQRQLRLNSAVAAAVTWAFAEMDVDWTRQGRKEIEALIARTDLEQQMRMFNVWEPWVSGQRGRERAP